MTDGRWPAEIVGAVPRLATQIARRAPSWARDEVAEAAAMAMWEAWARGEVHSTGGLRTVGRKAAGRAMRSAVYGCGEWVAYRVAERIPAPARLGGDLDEEGSSFVQIQGGDLPAHASQRLGPVLGRLAEALATQGMERHRAEAAIELVADLAADIGVHAVYNGATSDLASRTGLDPRSCRALVVLMIGQPRARNGGPYPGLVERAASGSDVWNDPRVVELVAEVVRPSRAYVRGAWSNPGPGAAA